MKHYLVHFMFILLIVSGLSGSTGDVSGSEISQKSVTSLAGNDFNSLNQPKKRSILSLSDEQSSFLVAALDGTIYLMEPQSRKTLWSFTSGPSIYSSYQAPIQHYNDKKNASGPGGSYFIDCGDDWELYMHNKLGKVKLQMSVEDFLRITPQVTDDGEVILGSKKTTVFLVDAKTGRLIYTYGLSDSLPTSQSSEEINDLYTTTEESKEFGDELPLYIMRTDYSLKSFDQKSGKVLWNMTVAEIRAAFLCHNVDDSYTGALSDSGYELPSEPGPPFNMPLSCQSKAVVFRSRNHNLLEYFHRPNMLPEADNEVMMLALPTSNHMLPSQSKFIHHKNKIFSEPASSLMLPSQLNVDQSLDSHQNSDKNNESDLMIYLPSLTQNSGILTYSGEFSMLSLGSSPLFLIPVIILVGCVTYYWFLVARKQVKLNKHPSKLNALAVPSKKKKIRKSGKNCGTVEKKERNTSPNLEDESEHVERDNKMQLNLYQSTNVGTDGRTIGKLFVSNTEIAKGSNGTIVLEGIYEGRPVAVKRLVKAHHDVAFKEIQNLIASDRHPNIVRWYGVECDQDFVYLSLERCTCSLYDLIQMSSDLPESQTEDQAMKEYKVHLDSMKSIMQDVKLWKENCYPSPILLKLMRDIVSGLVHLHELGIIHRDLKPQNVLIIKDRYLCAKLSDMGISRRLVGDMSSLDHHATGNGSSGWQAPEQLLHGRQTRAVDMFSLGCVLFFCITSGRHPFGNHLERDINITKNQMDLFLVENIPEAVDLFLRLFDPNAELRPKALEVFHHPLFWNSEMRLSFLRDSSDRVELEDRETVSDILKALESIAPVALGAKWDEKLEPAFINNIGRYRRYKFDSVRDLLRVMRNKLNHYRELPIEIQEILGPVPEGFDGYFASRFPKLLIEVYKVLYQYCREEECFHRYFEGKESQW